jgi:hypothetical protein
LQKKAGDLSKTDGRQGTEGISMSTYTLSLTPMLPNPLLP